MVNLKNAGIIQFAERVKGRKVYGFGAVPNSLTNHRLLRTPDHDLWTMLHKIVDNDPEKQGKDISDGEHRLPVISFDDFCAEAGKEDVILILGGRYGEIMEQLDAESIFDQQECYILEFIDCAFDSRIDETEYEQYQGGGKRIPPVIHYCWFGGKELPEAYQEYMRSWEKYCPDYEIRRWDESNYDIEKHPYMKQAYEHKKWAFVSDYARLDILYRYGGIYLDNDVELLKSLDELRDFPAYMGYETTEIVNTGLGFGSEKENGIIRQCMDAYDQINVAEPFQLIPCTIHQTNVLKNRGLRCDNSFQMLPTDKIAVLPSEFLCGKRLGTNFRQITKHTFSIHHFAGDWGGRPSQISIDRHKKYDGLLWKRIYGSENAF